MNELAILIFSAVINGAVTWGVVSTKIAWMRADLDDHHDRLTYLERGKNGR